MKFLIWKCREPKLEMIWLRYSLQCHLAFDGDKLLMVNHPTLIEVAERNNKEKNIAPLFYHMSKAKAETITLESLYRGLIAAYTGGNIGEISNAITKIWNSGEITEEKLKAIKWLVLINNFVIDFAKTLYKPTPPKEVTQIINRYTKGKVPAFFRYAKDKEKEQVELISNSTVDRIRKIYKKKNLNYNFNQDNIGTFDYKVLMNNPDIEFDQDVAIAFKIISSTLNFNQKADKQHSNYENVYLEAKNKLLNMGYEEKDLVDILILDLFNNRKTPKKKAFWTLFGDVVYENISKNIKNNFIQCGKCHRRFYRQRVTQKYCSKCSGYDKLGKKIIICCDCGAELEVDARNMTKIRCKECQSKVNKEKTRERVKRYKELHR